MEWVKSSFSNGNGGNNCVEVHRAGDGGWWVRNSKRPELGPLHFESEEWSAFLAGVKAGEFDDV